MQQLRIKRAQALKGRITVPGDKSISHRAIMFGAIASGRSVIHNLLAGEDCLNTKKAFQRLGIKFARRGKALIVYGRGLRGLRPAKAPIDCGNSGTTMRLLSGILAGQEFRSVLTGDQYLRRRPMKRIIAPLTLMGAKIKAVKGEFAPLIIDGGDLQGISYRSPLASAQVKSCVLLAGLYSQGRTSVREPQPSRDHTERMLKYLGARLQTGKLSATVTGGSRLKGKKITVPGDISSAAFFIVAACLVPGSNLTITGVGINPTRNGLIQVLKKMGASIQIKNKRFFGNEPVADLNIKYSRLRGINVRGRIIPNIIDEIPVLTVAAALASGRTVISEARELRVKETDRIRSMASQLGKMGAVIKEKEDGLIIEGIKELKGAKVNSFGDHRTAMSLAIAGMLADGSTTINDTSCINTSFPGFLSLLNKLTKGDRA